jgi:hypothetical protein
MSNIKTPIEIDELYNSGEITIGESGKLRDIWNNKLDEDKISLTPITKTSTNLKSEQTDREVQEAILSNLKNISKSNNTISNWVTFLGLLQLFGIIASIIIYLINLS